MAKKSEPIITYTEILALAGKEIRGEIIKLRTEAAEMQEKAKTPEQQDLVANFIKMGKEREQYHMRRLEAIETMYLIQNGANLGIIEEFQE